MEDYKKVELTKLGGRGYGIILWKDEQSKSLSYAIEPAYPSSMTKPKGVNPDLAGRDIVHGRPDLIIRNLLDGSTESFVKNFDVGNGRDLDRILYEKAREIAEEKSRLFNIAFVDSTKQR